MQGSWVNKTDAGSQQYFLNKNGQRKAHFLLQFYEMIIGNLSREKMFQIFTGIPFVIMFETVDITRMEQDKNNHNFSVIHTIRLVVMILYIVFNHIFFLL